MEKYYLQSLGTSIVSAEGDKLGKLKDIIFNPETGKICAFAVSSTAHGKVVSPIDVLRWNREIQIHDQFDIVPIDEINKLQKILDKNIIIINNKVYTKDGEYVGKVGNIGIESRLLTITCLIVAKRMAGVIQYDEKIIPAKDIIEITKSKIIIKNLAKPVKLKKLKVDMAPVP